MPHPLTCGRAVFLLALSLVVASGLWINLAGRYSRYVGSGIETQTCRHGWPFCYLSRTNLFSHPVSRWPLGPVRHWEFFLGWLIADAAIGVVVVGLATPTVGALTARLRGRFGIRHMLALITWLAVGFAMATQQEIVREGFGLVGSRATYLLYGDMTIPDAIAWQVWYLAIGLAICTVFGVGRGAWRR